MPQQQFSSLEQLNVYVDAHAAEYAHMGSIGNLYQGLRDQFRQLGDAENVQRAQIEQCCYNFSLHDEKLGPLYSGINENSQPWEWPSVGEFTPQDLAYLKERLNSSTSPVVGARYAHVLFSATRHNQYAAAAIQHYLAAVPLHQRQDLINPTEHHGLRVADSLVAAAAVGLASKSELLDSIIDRMLDAARTFPPDSSIRENALLSLVGFVLENRKRLPHPRLADWMQFCAAEADRLYSRKNYHGSVSFNQYGQRISKALGVPERDWEFQLGRCYEQLMEAADEPDGLVQISFCEDAIRHYQQAKDRSRLPALQARLTELKPNARYGSVSTEIDLGPVLAEAANVAKQLLVHGSDAVIQFLMNDKSLLPRLEDLMRMARQQAAQFPLLSDIPGAIVDAEGNTVQHFSSPEERERLQVLQLCRFWLETFSSVWLQTVLFGAIQGGVLDTVAVARYLAEHSWLGKTLSRGATPDKPKYRWMDLVLPAIHEYITGVQMHLRDTRFRPNFILCIDSLTTKIEGMVRDMCHLSGVATTKVKADPHGHTVTIEKDLHELLYEDAVCQLFDQDDLLFLRFLLVEQAGYALRHKVAHALMRPLDYQLGIVHLALLAVFRIGRYDLAPANSNSDAGDPGSKDRP